MECPGCNSSYVIKRHDIYNSAIYKDHKGKVEPVNLDNCGVVLLTTLDTIFFEPQKTKRYMKKLFTFDVLFM